MDRNINIEELVKTSDFKITVVISVIIIIMMYMTQTYWINSGLKIIYPEYRAEGVLESNDIPDGVIILSGNYTYISHWINTSTLSCKTDADIKLLIYSYEEFKGFNNVVILKAIEGCN
jgi:hypothetical protein